MKETISLASSAAFSAAANGQQTVLKKFLDEYPSFKSKPSLWGTTLLYTAALNNHFEIIKYLVEKVHCPVNARNWRDMHQDTSSSDGNKRNPTPGSTALHGACSNGHLQIVEYLVREKDADYFIKNQAGKTPIEYGEQHSSIKRFFQDYLLASYSNSSSDVLPHKSIIDEDRPQQDCIWEYKPLQEPEWRKFSVDETHSLHQAMISKKNFQLQIALRTDQGPVNVSLAKLLQSNETDSDSQKNQAWIRCRGSNVLNFDIHAIWQLMFMRYPKTATKTSSSLTVSHLPTMFDSHFTVELNKWYMCDTRTNVLLNTSMNYRRKVVITNVHLGINEEAFTCNLHAFTFANDDKTVVGYLRWIPKLISNDKHNPNMKHEVDNFQPITDAKPMSITTESLANEMTNDDEEFRDEQNDIGDIDDDDTNAVG